MRWPASMAVEAVVDGVVDEAVVAAVEEVEVRILRRKDERTYTNYATRLDREQQRAHSQ